MPTINCFLSGIVVKGILSGIVLSCQSAESNPFHLFKCFFPKKISVCVCPSHTHTQTERDREEGCVGRGGEE
jgi:hypothetical protein